LSVCTTVLYVRIHVQRCRGSEYTHTYYRGLFVFELSMRYRHHVMTTGSIYTSRACMRARSEYRMVEKKMMIIIIIIIINNWNYNTLLLCKWCCWYWMHKKSIQFSFSLTSKNKKIYSLKGHHYWLLSTKRLETIRKKFNSSYV